MILQVIVNKGTWPPKTSIAVFVFETKDGGKQWFEEFTASCKESNIAILDSVLGATREESQNGKLSNLKLTKWQTLREIFLAIRTFSSLDTIGISTGHVSE